jgi:hypothetical protein
VDNDPYLLRAAELNNLSMPCGMYINEAWPRLVEGDVRVGGYISGLVSLWSAVLLV